MDLNKIKELRAIIPVPITEAKELLQNNAQDVEQCVYLYKEKALKQIMQDTGCSRQMAASVYEDEKLDLNRTISVIREILFDKNYKHVAGIDSEKLLYVRDWMYILRDNDLGISLSYKHLHQVIAVFKRLPKLKEIAILLEETKQVYDKIFEGYSDDMPMSEFIRRNCLLDGSPIFRKAFNTIPLQIEAIKDEMRRHWRNVRDEGENK